MRTTRFASLSIFLVCASALQAATATVTLTASPNPSIYGKAVTLAATVTSGASGNVTFYNGPVMLGVGTIAGQTASISTIGLPAGVQKLSAYYAGGAGYAAAYSNTISQTVMPVANTGFTAGGAFGVGGSFAIGTHPAFVAVGDFNGDGKADMVVASTNTSTTGSFSILLGNGDGTFQTGVQYPLSGWAAQVAIGDFDGDGKTDLAVTVSNKNTVTIFLGNGDGTFRTGSSYTVGNRPMPIAVADFDRDGKADLAVGNVLDGSVNVLLGNGDGTFRQGGTYSTGNTAPVSVVVADFNADGVPDLALGDTDVVVLLGKGDGSFQAAAIYPTWLGSEDLAVGDFNGDGKMDLVAVGADGWAILLGKGDGTFQAAASTVSAVGTSGAVVGDFNGDGKADIALAMGTESGTQGGAFLYGNGDGTFQSPVTYPANMWTWSLAAADFNGDGRVDVAILDSGNQAVRMLLAAIPSLGVSLTHLSVVFQGITGASSIITVTNSQAIPTTGAITVTDTLPAGLTATSMNGAGWGCVLATLTCTRSDALAAGRSYPPVTLTYNVALNAPAQVINTVSMTGGGAPSASASDPTSIMAPLVGTTTTLTASPNPSTLGQSVTLAATTPGAGVLGKVTFYDGVTILGVGLENGISFNPTVTLTTNLLPAGTHSLSAHYGGDNLHGVSTSATISQTVRAGASSGFGWFAGYAVPGNAYSIAVGDFNRDGKVDVVIANGTGISVLLGNGDNSFQPPVSYTANTAAQFVAVADFNGDGNADVITANPANNGVTIFLGNGNGTFQAGVSYAVGVNPYSIVVADFDGNGTADLAVANAGSGTVSILLGKGDGTFASMGEYPVGAGLYSIAAADFNGDAKADLAVTSTNGSVNILLGNGDGTFQLPVSYLAGNNAIFVAVADFNGDGKADLAVINGAAGVLNVMSGKGDGTFVLAHSTGIGQNPVALAVGDFNGDGVADIAVVSSSSRGAGIFLGNGDGTFTAGGAYAPGSSVSSVAVGDFNGDGKADLALTIGSTATLNSATPARALERAMAATVSNVVILTGGASPALAVTSTHAATFVQGQTGAAYALIVTNTGASSQGTVTVTDTLPAGLTATGIAGPGWTCVLATLTCTRSDVLSAGASYPAIALTVNVAPTEGPVMNNVSVSGGGSGNAAGTDPTVVVGACLVSVTPLSPGVNGAGGNITLTINGGFGTGTCGWTATANAGWLTPAVTGGTGGSLAVAAAANTTGLPRSGAITVGGQTVNVTQAANLPGVGPSLVSLTPFQGMGAAANLTLVYADANGWAAIQSAEFIINPRWEPGSRGGGCYVKYAPATGMFTLIADDGTTAGATAAAGLTGTLSNSQCTLNLALSSVTGSGNTLTIVAALTFQPNFAGQRHIWMQASDYNNLTTNWLVYGVWFPTQTAVAAGPWYRIYDPNSKSYLYSADPNEYTTLGAQGFQQQGTSGLVMNGPLSVGGVSNMAWYRVYVNATSSHFWTSDRNEFLTLINTQTAYVGEGVAGFIMPYLNALGQVSPQVTNTIPFYRAAFQGKNLHFWTADPNEYAHLPAGYLGEGIASYIFPAAGAQLSGAPVETEAATADDGSAAVVSVVNAASYVRNGVIAPGQVLSILGRHLGGAVLFNGVPAETIAERENEIRVLVPNDLAGAAEVTMEVEHRGRRTPPVKLGVAAADPAIFTGNAFGRGNAEARNEDGTANDADHAAARASVVTVYVTGLPDVPMEAHIGGLPAEVLSTRMSGTRAGVREVQVRVPPTLDPAAFQPVVLHVGNFFTQPGVGLAIR